MKTVLSHFFTFLRHPAPLHTGKYKTQLLKDFFCVAAFLLLSATIVVLLLAVLIEFGIVSYYETDVFKKYSTAEKFLLACLVAPVLEEMIFRYYLKDFYLSIYFVATTSSIFINKIMPENAYLQIGVFCFAMVFVAILEKRLRRKTIYFRTKLWLKYFPAIFYFNAVIFGLAHLSNYKALNFNDPSFILYILSQTIGSLGLGYIRIKHGIVYSILLHSLFNFILLSPYLISK